MGFSRSLSLAPTAALLILEPGTRFSRAQAQPMVTSPAHVPVPTEAAMGALISLALAVLLIALTAAGVWYHQQRRRRREEARELEDQLAAAFRREPRLTGLVLVAKVWRMVPGRLVKVAIAGSIPKSELRALVLQIAREETKYCEGKVVFEDALTVSPAGPPIAA